ncbi:MAG: hypothetical protein WBX30_20530 [Stellaceae bacterium]
MRKPASAKATTIRAAKASGSPRAVSLIVFAMIRSTVALSPADIPLSLAVVHAALTPQANRRADPGLVAFGKPTYLPSMTPDLTDEETAALVRLLSDAINNDRYPLSPRIQTLKGILAKIRPEPAREPLPPPKVYTPPRAAAARRLRRG